MRKTTTNLFLASSLFVVACITYVFFFLNTMKDSSVTQRAWLEHSYSVILMTETMLGLFEGSLAEQRGYILTGDPEFAEKFNMKSQDLMKTLKNLKAFTTDNAQQHQKVEVLEEIAVAYISLLESRSKQYQLYNDDGMLSSEQKSYWDGLSLVESFHERFFQISDEFLKEEQSIMLGRFAEYNESRQQYSQNFVASLVGACVLIILSNWLILTTQKKYLLEKKASEKIDNRYSVAVKATNDGIFDWNIENKEIFLSSQIFKMCGYDLGNYEGSLFGVIPFMKGKNPLDLIHPDDRASFQSGVQLFQEGHTSEYNNIFRVKHANGYWVWIHARGAGLYRKQGAPYRLIGTHTDITASKLMEERLKMEKDAADNSSKMKMEFLSHMSHEIRTPLTTITGVAEILAKGTAHMNERERLLVGTLNTSSSTLKELINDILDFSRIDSGEIKLAESDVLIDSLFEQVISILSVQAIEKNIQFSSEYQNLSGLVFKGDEGRIRQILLNLGNNAIKFTEQGSVRIVPSLIFDPKGGEKNKAARVRIDVVDSGIGISANDLGMIFDQFHQVDSTVSKKYKGTGLGLPICKKLAEAMGGEIEVVSNVGKGSVFSLVLPVEVIDFGEALNNKPKTSVASSSQNDNASSTERNILLVEDYAGNVVVIGYMLEDLGYKYDVAQNGKDALEKARQNSYDAILMDIQMPVMDGLTAARMIRQYEEAEGKASVPIIGMTAHATYKDMEKCLEAGMSSYLSKPLNLKEFEEQLQKHVKKKVA
ncbi:MAG: ATP-binding protein [Pseudobdellovibrionaceae bacterium]|nr:ATP-binding protein [Pseudobdellovibrionaceae bacterium]